MWIIIIKGTAFAIGAAWDTKEDAERVAAGLVPQNGEEFEVVFQSASM